MKEAARNMARCRKCGDVVESKHVHDFAQCSCGACAVDGGHDYQRIVGELDFIDVFNNETGEFVPLERPRNREEQL